jgi:hypothetical protein
MGETMDNIQIDIIHHTLSFFERNIESPSHKFHDWSFIAVLIVMEDHFFTDATTQAAQFKFCSLQQDSLSILEFLGNLQLWGSFMAMFPSDLEFWTQFCEGLNPKVYADMRYQGYTFTNTPVEALIFEANISWAHISKTISYEREMTRCGKPVIPLIRPPLEPKNTIRTKIKVVDQGPHVITLKRSHSGNSVFVSNLIRDHQEGKEWRKERRTLGGLLTKSGLFEQ